jgi:hypothetical protein
MVTKKDLKEAKQFKTQMLWCGILTLPIYGLGIIFLLIYGHMRSLISKYEANEA